MCLSIDKSKNQHKGSAYIPTTADKDIVVWKVGCVYNVYKFEQIFRPRYHSIFEYSPGILTPKEDLIVSEGRLIHRGYHAFVNKKYADSLCRSLVNEAVKRFTFNETVERFIIPKGSQYFIGEDNDIVATQLVWKPNKLRTFFCRIFKLKLKNITKLI